MVLSIAIHECKPIAFISSVHYSPSSSKWRFSQFDCHSKVYDVDCHRNAWNSFGCCWLFVCLSTIRWIVPTDIDCSDCSQSIITHEPTSGASMGSCKSCTSTPDHNHTNSNIIQCYKSQDSSLEDNLITKCSSLNRIKNVLNEKEKFIQYIQSNENSKHFLNDYIHIVEYHDDACDLTDINIELIQKYAYESCDMNNCIHLNDHFRRSDKVEGDRSIFYEDHFNQLHCLFYHLFDLSLRTDQTTQPTDVANDNNDIYFDQEFGGIRDGILARREKSLNDIPRYNNNENSKYNLKVVGMYLIRTP